MRWTVLSTRLVLLPIPLCGHSQFVDFEGEGTRKFKLMEIERVREQPVAKLDKVSW